MTDLITALAPYGPVGLFCAYLIYREQVRDRRDAKRDERIEAIMKDSTESNKDLTVALTVLAERVRP